MRILHVNSYFAKSPFYKNLYEKQLAHGLDIAVYVPSYNRIADSGAVFNTYTTFVKNHSKIDRLLFRVKHYKIWKHIQKTYRLDQFDVVHAHSLFSNGYIAYKIKQRYHVPYMVAVRNTDVNVFFKYMKHLKGMGLAILDEASAIIFLSEAYRDAVFQKFIPAGYRQAFMKKSFVVPNGIDDFWIGHAAYKTHVPKNSICIVYAGVINKNKNILTTAAACKILLAEGYRVQFTVVGKIADRHIYRKLSQLPFVRYIPPQTKEQLCDLYKEQDLFVMPSKTETFGLVYAEAMSQGLPILYSAGQGFDGQFPEGTVGFHVDPADARDVAAKIKCVLQNYTELSAHCMKLCTQFDWEQITRRYIELYQRICK